jgi:DNA-binding CsgD family transcriptional regulator
MLRLSTRQHIERRDDARDGRWPTLCLHRGRTMSPVTEIPATLFGRERELSELRVHLAAALAGSGSLVLIGGEAGIGKTALADMLCREAEARGALVVTGRCFDMTQTPPYGPWISLFEQYLRTKRATPPPPVFAQSGAVGSSTNQTTLFRQVSGFLEEAATSRPLLLLLEDLHWSDPESLDLLRGLAHDLAHQAILLVVTYRADELARGNPLHALMPLLVRESRASRIDLRRLEPQAVDALIEKRYTLSPVDRIRLGAYLERRAEGNPLFVEELLRTLVEERLLLSGEQGDTLEDLSEVRVPLLLRQVIEGRLARLGAANELLAVAAVIGQEVPLDLWMEISGADDESLSDVMERAAAARLMEEQRDGKRAHFVHALIRETLYDGIPAPRRHRLHRTIGEFLAALPNPDADAVAHHFLSGMDERAVTWLIAAAEWAEGADAWMTAAERFEAAIALLTARGANAGDRGWLFYRVALLRRFGDAPGSVRALEEAGRLAVEAGDEALAAHAMVMRGHVRCFAGDLAGGIAELEAGIAAVDALPATQRSRHEVINLVEPTTGTGVLVLWLARVGRLAESRALGESYIGQASSRDAHGIVAPAYVDAFFGMGDLYTRFGEPERARQAYDAARSGYDALEYTHQAHAILLNTLNDVIVPYYTDTPSLRRSLIAEAERAAGPVRAIRGSVPDHLEHLPYMAVDAIDWSGAPALAAWAANSPSAQEWATEAVVSVLLAQGDVATLEFLLAHILPDGSRSEPGDVYFQSATALQRAAATVSLRAGDLPTARRWLEAFDRWMAWSGGVLGLSEGAVLWAEYSLQAGDSHGATRYAERALALATHPRQPLALLGSLRLVGHIDTIEGRFEDAESHLKEALQLAETCGAPFERALTLLEFTELRLAQRRVDEATNLLGEVQAICEPLDARPTLQRLEALRQRVTQTPRKAPLNPGGLSQREAEVLRLVAEGLTDAEVAERLFISRRTVTSHMTSIYNKLGVNSRAAAVAAGGRLSIL